MVVVGERREARKAWGWRERSTEERRREGRGEKRGNERRTGNEKRREKEKRGKEGEGKVRE